MDNYPILLLINHQTQLTTIELSMQKTLSFSIIVAISLGVFAPLAAAEPNGEKPSPAFCHWAERPIRGWNSWDCFGAGDNQEQTLANAQSVVPNRIFETKIISIGPIFAPRQNDWPMKR